MRDRFLRRGALASDAVHNQPGSRNMKITYVTEAWPPVLNEAALAAARMVSHLRARGHGVELVRPKQHAGDAGDTNTVTVPAIGVPLLPHLKLGLPMRQRLLKRWDAARPDV